ncbi:hypothetical protein IGB42_01891 [Andreprevotia sp. IGB-42]|uniref:hypothetical protein n=1 Tax=Andreprevotia sp. IGB-42 TaxID=2497473 RepID=UPI0013576F1D|nr:hypothetical protein [Andreprevotia sp. IGB-42]KAF0813540.1 hypothetical protein IGB42_01891 [Andreprevotia sp. IGB-42]
MTAANSDPAEPLCVVFIPALVALLARAEALKGDALTEQEVLVIRDAAHCMTLPASALAVLEESRGYADIDAGDCWAEWQAVREQIMAEDGDSGAA